MKRLLPLLTLCICPALSAQNLILNGGFETPAINGAGGGRVPYTSFAGWFTGNINGDSPYGIDIVSYQLWQPHSGDQSLDLVSDYCPVGNFLRQDISTVPQQRYEIGLWFANNYAATSASAHLAVRNGSLDLLTVPLFHAGSTPLNMGWQFISAQFVAESTSTIIMFVHDGAVTDYPGNTGLALDDVSVVAVPEPGSVVLLGLGLAVLAFAHRSAFKH